MAFTPSYQKAFIQDGNNTSQFWTSGKPAAGEEIEIWYSGKHDYITTGGMKITATQEIVP